MKLNFKNADKLAEAIEILAPDLGIEVSCECQADCIVTVSETDKSTVSVKLDGKCADITYGGGTARFCRGLAKLVKWLKDGKNACESTENPIFTLNGAMIDMSRNAVMNVKTVKFTMRKMALMGMNCYMLYTEDTYEIENRPFFGYMRGAYTKDEIRELDSYAMKLGIELIPCVQMLGHLATHLRWAAAGKYKDTVNALLAGADETYALIDDMLKTISETFTTRRIHIGMDETHDLGTGAYLNKNGYRERKDIYLEHLNKINDMIKSYGLKPMMWSDMFFRLAGKDIPGFGDYDQRVEFTDDIKQYLPDGMQQVFWDYYHPNEEFYAVNIEKHEKYLGGNTMFAGGVWCWSGHCPHYSRSLRNTIPALDACRKNGVKEVIATVWHNGCEASLVMGMAGLAWYADYDYKGVFDLDGAKECFAYSCYQDYDSFMKCEAPEYPHGGDVGASRAILYNDPLNGLIDKHLIGLDTQSYYKNVTAQLDADTNTLGEFAPAYDVILKLSSLLENKADFGIRLKAAYDAGDKQTMAAMALECDTIIEKLQALRKSHRASWMRYNKPFGWEVHDIRYGGLIMRFDTAKERILEYLGGSIEAIEELEAERRRIDGISEDSQNRITGRFLWNQYTTIATASRL